MFFKIMILIGFVLSSYSIADDVVSRNGDIVTVIANGEYFMGDSDNKINARNLAVEQAKINASEIAGTYIESSFDMTTKDNNGEFSKITTKELRSFTSSMIKSEIITDKVELFANQVMVYKVTIKATVDLSTIKQRIKELSNQKVREKNLAKIENENKEPLSLPKINVDANELEKNIYLGIGTTKGSGTQTRQYSSSRYYNQGTYETKYDTSNTQIKLGYIFKSKNRFEFSVSNIMASKTSGSNFSMNKNDTKNSEFIGYDFDFLFTFKNQESLQPYFGFGFGIYKNNDINSQTQNTREQDTETRGLALNGMIGAIYQVNNTLEFEVGYKLKNIKWDLDNPNIEENIKYLYFGANIKF